MSNTPTAADQLEEAALAALSVSRSLLPAKPCAMGCLCRYCELAAVVDQLAAALRRHDEERGLREAELAALEAITEWITVLHDDEEAMAYLPSLIYCSIRKLLAARQTRRDAQ